MSATPAFRPAVPPSSTPPVRGEAPARGWEAALGGRWRLHLGLLALLLLAAGALRAPSDPDLPQHLAIGRWIVAHGWVPLTEPLAWTRAGAEYYALSWLPQLAFFATHQAAGVVGLALLDGVLFAGAGVAVAVLGRVARWTPGATLALAALNVIVAAVSTPGLRPLLLLFTILPLAWAATVDAARRGIGARHVVTLGALSAVAANSHLFFPAVLAPVVALWAGGWMRARPALAAGASVAAGWLVTPYVLHWPALLRLYLTPSAMLRHPSPIVELQPGFGYLIGGRDPATLGVVLALLAFPWIVARAPWDARRRSVAALYWTLGLVGFAYAVRLLAPWWLVTFPLLGIAALDLGVERTVRPVRRSLLLVVHATAALAIATLALAPSRESGAARTGSTAVASADAAAVEPLLAWLADNTRGDVPGRALTTFDNGAFVAWRLPRLSPSVDSRGLFPDSALAGDLSAAGLAVGEPLGAWRSAELAIVPLDWRVAAVLDTARGWRRARTSTDPATGRPVAALWVTDAWWARARRADAR